MQMNFNAALHGHTGAVRLVQQSVRLWPLHPQQQQQQEIYMRSLVCNQSSSDPV